MGFYQPKTGRFTTEDSWDYMNPDDPLSLNLYTYCNNNPIMMQDPYGHLPSLSQVGTAVAIVAVGAVVVVAVVATAGAAGAAVGMAAGMYLGASSATVAVVTTAATVGAYGVAAGIGATSLSNAGEALTGTNIIRDKVMGGNQSAYDTLEMGLSVCAGGIITVGSNNATLNSKPKDTTPNQPYANLKDPKNVAPGKDFTASQNKAIIAQNKNTNKGVVKSDVSGTILVKPSKSMKGVTPDPNEWQIDHIIPKAQGGTNSYSNAQVLSRQENRAKWDK